MLNAQRESNERAREGLSRSGANGSPAASQLSAEPRRVGEETARCNAVDEGTQRQRPTTQKKRTHTRCNRDVCGAVRRTSDQRVSVPRRHGAKQTVVCVRQLHGVK